MEVSLSGEMVDKLKEALNSFERLEFASLFGSLAVKGKASHDIDIAFKVSGGDKYSTLCKLLQALSQSLNVKEEAIDLVDLDRADLELKKEIVVNGLVLLDRCGYRRKLVEELDLKYPEYEEAQRLNLREWVESADPSNVNLSIVKRRMDFAKSEVHFLKENVLNRSMEEVKGSPILRRLMERGFHLTVEAVLDVCRHIVSSMGWGPALSYTDTLEICCKHEVLEEGLREDLVSYVRIRNIIIHRYLEVDYEKLYEESVGLEEVLRGFEKQILRFLRDSGMLPGNSSPS